MPPQTDTALTPEQLRAEVRSALLDHLGGRRRALDRIGPDAGRLAGAIADFVLDGGKRLRPTFCYWGWRGAGGAETAPIVAAAASLELLHAAALIHDDVMDRSDTRRGEPAVHRRFALLHRTQGWRGASDAFGEAAAILIGDLCLIWADGMLSGCGLPADVLAGGRWVYDEMRTELMAGQYLDLLEQNAGGATVEQALRVARFKSAKYTIERPLQLGAALAGGPPELLAGYSAYGLPLGEAFQLRDDVLGVFGDPEVTGKPAGDDLREGKRTALVALARERSDRSQRILLDRHLGDPALQPSGVAGLQAVIVDTGALSTVESLIDQRTEQAMAALDALDLPAAVADALAGLARAATARSV